MESGNFSSLSSRREVRLSFAASRHPVALSLSLSLVSARIFRQRQRRRSPARRWPWRLQRGESSPYKVQVPPPPLFPGSRFVDALRDALLNIRLTSWRLLGILIDKFYPGGARVILETSRPPAA